MGWAIDDIIWHKVRDEILKDKYAGCCYSMASSFSPVIINHRKSLTGANEEDFQAVSKKIRVEFEMEQ